MTLRLEITHRAAADHVLYLRRGETLYIIHVRDTGQELLPTTDTELPEV